MKAKKLIEVAMPIKEISAESVRDNRLTHGHIKTLHMWWARRPLPVCRAIVFASLVPDPLDDDCPVAFRDAVDAIIGNGSPDAKVRGEYRPYDDIPYTAIYDPMEDNLRNRLMMFIGKFSSDCQKNMKNGKATPPKVQLSDGSLIKWENKNNPRILRMARELIWVAYNADKHPNAGYETLHREFSEAFDAITAAENELYAVKDRHIESEEVKILEAALQQAIDNFQNQMPSVFDPFAGGGAIPLEAARLGCRSYGNDINPVAHIIERGSAELPQKYGKPIVYSLAEFKKLYGDIGIQMAGETERGIIWNGKNQSYTIPNRLAFDVEFFAKRIIENTEKEYGHLYPIDSKGNKPVAYYWARTAKCSNPSCGADVPLLRQFYLANTKNKKIYLNPIIKDNCIEFEIKKGSVPLSLKQGWQQRGNLVCPCCGNVTNVEEIKKQSCHSGLNSHLLVVITEGEKGKEYRIPTIQECSIPNSLDTPAYKPQEKIAKNSGGGDTLSWGVTKWGQLFSDRQLITINGFIENYQKIFSNIENDYQKALAIYMSIWIDRICLYNTTFGVYESGNEKVNRIFGRQAIPMVFDYPESNPFCGVAGSALNQLDWILRYIESESNYPFMSKFANASSGEKNQFPSKSITVTVTDPPYYDAIAYADISDFFYVWLKKSLGSFFPINFATPQTPKMEECTALKHYHNGNYEKAKVHFQTKLTNIFDAIEQQTEELISIMFAHQSTEAWSTLCNSILSSRMNITGSWPMDTEMAGGMKADKATLESSVTVACRPSERRGFGEYREVKREIEKKVSNEVEKLYALGFRGADLLTACFGQAVSEFGHYKAVEKADGSEVNVTELLDLAKSLAFETLIKGVQGDDFTRFYIGWLYINGAGDSDFDDATKFTRVGVNVDIKEIHQQKLLVLEGKKLHLAMSDEHIGQSSVEGTRQTDSPITQAHRAIILWRQQDRIRILRFVRDIAPEKESTLWRLLATLKELLPAGDELKQVQGLLQNSEDLRQHCHDEKIPTQQELNFQTT